MEARQSFKYADYVQIKGTLKFGHVAEVDPDNQTYTVVINTRLYFENMRAEDLEMIRKIDEPHSIKDEDIDAYICQIQYGLKQDGKPRSKKQVYKWIQLSESKEDQENVKWYRSHYRVFSKLYKDYKMLTRYLIEDHIDSLACEEDARIVASWDQSKITKYLYSTKHTISLQPFQISEMMDTTQIVPKLHRGKYLLVKTVTQSSSCKPGYLKTIVVDQNEIATVLYFTGCIKETRIPIDAYLIINEPLFNKYDEALRCYPILGIDDLTSVIFHADQLFRISVPFEMLHSRKDRVQSLYSCFFKFLVQEIDDDEFTILSLDERDFIESHELIFRDSQQILQTKVISIDQVRNHTFKVKIESSNFSKFVKQRFAECPGSILELICLKQNQQIDPLAVIEDELRDARQPLKYAQQFMAILDCQKSPNESNIFRDVRQLVNDNFELILAESNQSMQKQSLSFQDLEQMGRNIDQILQNLDKEQPNSQFFNSIDVDVVYLQSITSFDLRVAFERTKLIHADEVTLSLKQTDEQMRNKSLFYLRELKYSIKTHLTNQQTLDINQFIKEALTNKFKQEDFAFEQDLSVLKLIGLEPQQDLIASIRNKRAKKKLKKQAKKHKIFQESLIDNLNIENDQPITYQTNVDEYREQVQEFFEEEKGLSQQFSQLSLSNLNMLDGKQRDKQPESDEETVEKSEMELSISDIQTITTTTTLKSLLTVHSRALEQKQNDHWKERATERAGLEIDDPIVKQNILMELKRAISHDFQRNVTQSTKNPDRFIVTLEDGYHVVVARHTSKSDGKTLYVPVTVLAPHMHTL